MAKEQQMNWLDSTTTVKRLSAGFPEKMVLLDCETTGGKATYHRMTEVAALVVENGEIVERWQSLINPEMHIPPEIQRLTGITPALVKDAPLFADIADELLERLEGRVLVAHNARFDYGFLKNEFGRIGYQYSTKPLCSVKLSRRVFPQYKSHSLNALIRRFNIAMDDRHRAMADTQAIWQFFLKISAMFNEEDIEAACAQLSKRPALPMLLDAAEVDKLPKAPGVYYFYDTRGKLLYIGKSVNIRERVMSHFTQDYRNPKDLEMSALIAHIDFEQTPSDLGAQLRESQQIKVLNPHYNRRLRKVVKLYQYQMEPDELGYLRLSIHPVENATDCNMEEQFGLFRSRRQAEGRLNKLAEHFFLCQKLCGLQNIKKTDHDTPCFAYQLKRCLGACCQQETPEAYNQRVYIALKEYRYQAWPWPAAILLEERGMDGVQPPVKLAHADGSSEIQPVWHLLHEWRYITQINTEDELYDRGYQLANQQASDQTMLESSVPAYESLTDFSAAAAKTNDSDRSNELSINFDLDIYLILIRFLLNPEQMQLHGLRVLPLETFSRA